MKPSPQGQLLLMLALFFASVGIADAAESCEPIVGRFVSIDGIVQVQRGGASWQPSAIGDALCQQDTIRVGRRSRAAIALVNDAVVRIDQSTTLRLLDIAAETEKRSLMDLLRGTFKSFSRKPRLITVNSPYLNGTIEGTEFVLSADEDAASLTVLEGRVRAENAHGAVVAAAGEAAVARAGAAPELRTLVRPRDAVQWTLYYPPLLAFSGDAGSEDLAPALRTARERAAASDPLGALDALEAVPAPDRDARHLLYQAALLLALGQPAQAERAIEEALRRDPEAGLGYALRSVIGVVQLRRAEALADARRAVEIEPTAAASIALSYAQQADFRIGAARETMEAAVEAHRADALAWARLGELRLMGGDRAGAVAAAERASALEPDLARAQLVRGFTELAGFRDGQARDAFERAIALSSADPLAHLGLALAQISAGDLEAGRGQLEVAVALDSNSALLRAYLGKGYFEERRGPLDMEQFAIAKELDPNDPTAFLYDAIAKQTVNRPVEALRGLEESIARNDNRAVYRSRLLLDEDRAARGASVARVFDDLGFDRLGIRESAESLATDPASASAHRFLSDTYRAQSRREISRVSELLQAQMLQDVNINPVQPSVVTSNLAIVSSGGPSAAGFNEFTPLFERDSWQLNASGLLGNNDTWAGEAVVSTLFDNVSMSGGGFAFGTDGFRQNNDLRHRIANGFAQVAVTPAVNIQGEYRYRDTKHGDIFMNFDPDEFDPTLREDNVERVGRFGIRLEPGERSTVLLSAIVSNREFESSRSRELAPSGPVIRSEVSELDTGSDDATQLEGLYTFKASRFNLVAGGGYTRVDIDETLVATADSTIDPAPIAGCLVIVPGPPAVVPGPCPPPSPPNTPVSIDPPPTDVTTVTTIDAGSVIDDYRAYGYANLEVMPSVTVTTGVSYTDFQDRFGEFTRFNPKVGMRWDITDSLRLRTAYTRVVKPALASNRLLEPTQVAGFNQFFDDGNGTRSTRYGVALDWRAMPSLFVGGELSRRDIDHRVVDLTAVTADFQDREEHTHRAYLYWTPSARWALSAEAIYDKFENSVSDPDVPDQVITRSFPFRARYFHPGGLFLEGSATYVSQDVRRPVGSTLAQGDSSFGVLGLSAGYRLPKRLGIVSFSVDNLLDKKMDFQDDSYRNFDREPTGTPYTPERTFMGRVSLNFR